MKPISQGLEAFRPEADEIIELLRERGEVEDFLNASKGRQTGLVIRAGATFPVAPSILDQVDLQLRDEGLYDADLVGPTEVLVHLSGSLTVTIDLPRGEVGEGEVQSHANLYDADLQIDDWEIL